MSLIISRSEGETVYTVTSNHKSKCPLFCQILGSLCCSPVCSVSQRLKQRLGCALTALATIQIIVGIINLGFGGVDSAVFGYLRDPPYWLGGMFLTVGIMCILSEKFPSQCLVFLTVMMNLVSAGLAITAIVIYSMDLYRTQNYRHEWMCRKPEYERKRYGRFYWTTASPSKKAEVDEIYQKKLDDYKACQDKAHVLLSIYSGLDIMMIVLAVLQLCVTFSWSVLNIKALCKKEADGQEEDPELNKPLVEQETPNPVC